MIPFLIGFFIFSTSPGFIRPLIDEPIGRIMIGAAALGMDYRIAGHEKMVKIEV